jgi:hypothetical protein
MSGTNQAKNKGGWRTRSVSRGWCPWRRTSRGPRTDHQDFNHHHEGEVGTQVYFKHSQEVVQVDLHPTKHRHLYEYTGGLEGEYDTVRNGRQYKVLESQGPVYALSTATMGNDDSTRADSPLTLQKHRVGPEDKSVRTSTGRRPSRSLGWTVLPTTVTKSHNRKTALSIIVNSLLWRQHLT